MKELPFFVVLSNDVGHSTWFTVTKEVDAMARRELVRVHVRVRKNAMPLVSAAAELRRVSISTAVRGVVVDFLKRPALLTAVFHPRCDRESESEQEDGTTVLMRLALCAGEVTALADVIAENGLSVLETVSRIVEREAAAAAGRPWSAEDYLEEDVPAPTSLRAVKLLQLAKEREPVVEQRRAKTRERQRLRGELERAERERRKARRDAA